MSAIFGTKRAILAIEMRKKILNYLLQKFSELQPTNGCKTLCSILTHVGLLAASFSGTTITRPTALTRPN